jgi:RNA recognition motif-containing protein
MNIYVGNLPYSVRDEELRATFEAYGQVVAAEVIFDKRTRRSRGYGFVEMADDASATTAIAALTGQVHRRPNG